MSWERPKKKTDKLTKTEKGLYAYIRWLTNIIKTTQRNMEKATQPEVVVYYKDKLTTLQSSLRMCLECTDVTVEEVLSLP